MIGQKLLNVKKFKIFLLVAVGLLLGALLLAGCSKAGSKAGRGGAAGEVALYTIADPTGDWGFPSPYSFYPRGPGYLRASLIFDTLVWKDAQGYIPALADSWEYDLNKMAYTFQLHPGVRWHDGCELTSKDVVFTFQYLKEHPHTFFDVSAVDRVEAAGDHTVVIYLNKPYAPFLDFIAGSVLILPEHIWRGVDNPADFKEQKALVGSGPYVLADYSREQGTYLYEANESYYRGTPRVKKIKFVKLGPEMSAFALKQGQVDLAQVPAEMAAEVEGWGFKVLALKHDWLAKLMINHQKEPMNSAEFRRALFYAIDTNELVQVTQRGFALPGSPGLVPPDNPWFNGALAGSSGRNLKKVDEILSGLGYSKNSSGFYEKNGVLLELELLVSAGNSGVPGFPGEREAEFIKKQLEEAGIKIAVRSLESKSLDSRVNEWKFDLALSGHGGMGSDPDGLSRIIGGKSFLSARYAQNPLLNELLKRQVSESDVEKRKALINQVQEVYAGELPAIPLYYPNWYYAHNGLVNIYYTYQGIASGVPAPLNKMSFVL